MLGMIIMFSALVYANILFVETVIDTNDDIEERTETVIVEGYKQQ